MLLATNGGKFDAGTIIGCMILKVIYPEIEIVRTYDQAVINKADFIVNVSCESDVLKGRFGMNCAYGSRGYDQTEYSPGSMIWKLYGDLFIQIKLGDFDSQTLKRLVETIDTVVLMSVDKIGRMHLIPNAFSLNSILSRHSDMHLQNAYDNRRIQFVDFVEQKSKIDQVKFIKAMQMAEMIFINEVEHAIAVLRYLPDEHFQIV